MKNVNQDADRQWYRRECSESFSEPDQASLDHGSDVPDSFLPTCDLLDARRDIEQWQPFARGICALQFRCYGRLSSLASGRTLTSLDMLK